MRKTSLSTFCRRKLSKFVLTSGANYKMALNLNENPITLEASQVHDVPNSSQI